MGWTPLDGTVVQRGCFKGSLFKLMEFAAGGIRRSRPSSREMLGSIAETRRSAGCAMWGPVQVVAMQGIRGFTRALNSLIFETISTTARTG
ncbi:hypothetical protein [Pseudooceanicola sp.]|uniref:hypothetical protein n=1 Tax=Pseudooceanicola sp. TaxID=1914328 RepID=UPI00351319F2